jgi:hypothetical protein
MEAVMEDSEPADVGMDAVIDDVLRRATAMLADHGILAVRFHYDECLEDG